MKARPILFSGPMVRALLANQKTKTRRVVKPQPESHRTLEALKPGEWTSYQRRGDMSWENFGYWHCPHGQPGDFLWAREAWRTYASLDKLPPRQILPGAGILYDAGGTSLGGRDLLGMGKLRPSMFMPRWASRLTLCITGVRVERLQDISEEDAKAEGSDIMWDVMLDAGTFSGPGDVTQFTARDTFRDYINLLNKKRGYGWETNPWMWVVEFEVLKANVDTVLKVAA